MTGGTRAERYKVNKKGTEDKNYTRNDLLKVVGDIEKQEVKKPVGTRAKVKAVKESSRPETRSATTTKPKPAPPVPVKKKATPKGKFKKGDKVRVKYPDGMYEGVVKSSTAKRTIVFFAEDNTEDEFLPSEYNSIEIIKKAL